jgi:hypothetical protein
MGDFDPVAFERFKADHLKDQMKGAPNMETALPNTANFDPARFAAFKQGYKTEPVPQAEQDNEYFPYGSLAGGMFLRGPIGALGAAGGEGLQQVYQHATGDPMAPKSSVDAAFRMAKEAGLNVVGEKIGQAGEMAVKRLFQRAPVEDAQKAIDFAKSGMPQGDKALAKSVDMPLTPSQATESYYQEIAGNFAEGSFGGGAAMKGFHKKQADYLDEGIKGFAKQFGEKAEPPELGKAIIASATDNLDMARAPAKMIYKTVEQAVQPVMKRAPVYELRPGAILDKGGNTVMQQHLVGYENVPVGGAKIDLKALKQFAEPLQQLARNLKGLGSDVGGDDAMFKIGSLGDEVDFKTAQTLRSRLASMADVYRIDNKNAPAIGTLKAARKIIDEAMDDGLGRFDPFMRDQWREADNIYKGAEQRYNNKMIRELVNIGVNKKDGLPENVFAAAFQPGQETKLTRVKDAVGPETWRKVQAQGTAYIWKQAMDGGVLSGQKLTETLEKVGPGTLNVLYDKEQLKWLERFANLARQQQKQPAESTGRMLVQLKQGGAIVEVLGVAGSVAYTGTTGDISGSAMFFTLAPAAIGQLFTRPALAKAFVMGMTTKATSSDAIELARALVSHPLEKAGKVAQSVFVPREKEPMTQKALREAGYISNRTQAVKQEQLQ